MMILVVNSGSSSLKYQLFEMEKEKVLAKGKIERIGMETAIVSQQGAGDKKFDQVTEVLEHTTALRKVLQMLTDPKHGVIDDIHKIEAVGHRVVHGGEEFQDAVLVDDQVKQAIRRCYDLAPLHNPANLTGIEAAEAALPGVPQIAVFDTAFHQTMPKVSYLYALPKVLYRRYKIRRYGFHGTSHKYVIQRLSERLNKPLPGMRVISCHIGNGASITAVESGKSIDTSMGMTPLEGLVMGTRSGDIDPAIVPFIMAKEELTIGEVSSMLNKHSGLYGLSGISSDMREIEEAMMNGDERAKLAFQHYEYRIRKYIGAYLAAMNGVDAIIFTAGVGENSAKLREEICKNLTFAGVSLDEAANNREEPKERRISTAGSKVEVWVIPTDEELMIARDTRRVVSSLQIK